MAARRDRTLWPAHRLVILVCVAAVLAAGALFGLASTVGIQKALNRLAHPHWDWLVVAVGGEILAYMGYTVAYREVARADHGAELAVPKAAALVAAGFGVFVHGGGFALDAAIVVVIWHQTISASLTLPWIIAPPVGALLAAVALRFKARVRRWPLIGKPLLHALEALELVLLFARRPFRHGLAFVGTLTYWAGDVFCLWATLQAFSAQPPPVAQLVVGYSTGYALTRRALPLGGAGVVEILLPYSLGWLKIALLPALLAVFAYRLINLWLPMIPALAGLPTLRRLQAAAPSRRGRPSAASRSIAGSG